MPDIETLTPTYSDAAARDVPAAQRLLLDIIDTVREPLIVLDAEFRVTQANRAFFRTFRVEPQDTIGEVLFTLGDGQWDIAPLRELLRDKLAVEPHLNDFDVDSRVSRYRPQDHAAQRPARVPRTERSAYHPAGD